MQIKSLKPYRMRSQENPDIDDTKSLKVVKLNIEGSGIRREQNTVSVAYRTYLIYSNYFWTEELDFNGRQYNRLQNTEF